MICSKPKEQTARSIEEQDLERERERESCWNQANLRPKNFTMLMETKPWTIYWSTQEQKKE